MYIIVNFMNTLSLKTLLLQQSIKCLAVKNDWH